MMCSQNLAPSYSQPQAEDLLGAVGTDAQGDVQWGEVLRCCGPMAIPNCASSNR